MKVSNYNIFIDNKKYKNWLLFNTRTCSLLETSKDIKEILEATKENNAFDIHENEISEEIAKELIDCGVLVDSDFNELSEIIKNDSIAYERIKTHDSYFDLTICPTLNCNLKCTYCYEPTHSDSTNYGIMSESVQDKIVELYEHHCSYRKENNIEQKYTDTITWYGGEPLLCLDIINNVQSRVNKIAEKYGRKIKNSITTNGILLNKENVEILKETNIKDIQISVDGPGEIHNARRYYPADPSKSFDQIISNIKLLDDFFKVVIRVNVDNNNSIYVKELVEDLTKKGIWPKKNVKLHVSNVKCEVNDNFEYIIPHKEFEQIERDFRLQQLNIYNTVSKDKKAKLRLITPTLTKKGCRVAVNKNANVVGPKGEIYPCWSNVGNKKYIIGYIDDILQGNDLNIKSNYAISTELREKLGCYDCKIFPVCSITCQESFIRDGSIHPPFLCPKWKDIIEESILFNYDFENKNPDLSLRVRA